MLRLTDDKKRAKKEEDYRHAEMLRQLKHDHTKKEEEIV
jgi:hypothetical protein